MSTMVHPKGSPDHSESNGGQPFEEIHNCRRSQRLKGVTVCQSYCDDEEQMENKRNKKRSRRSSQTRKPQLQNETAEQRERRLRCCRERMRALRKNESKEETRERLEQVTRRARKLRSKETEGERERRREGIKERVRKHRMNLTEEQRCEIKAKAALQQRARRAMECNSHKRSSRRTKRQTDDSEGDPENRVQSKGNTGETEHDLRRYMGSGSPLSSENLKHLKGDESQRPKESFGGSSSSDSQRNSQRRKKKFSRVKSKHATDDSQRQKDESFDVSLKLSSEDSDSSMSMGQSFVHHRSSGKSKCPMNDSARKSPMFSDDSAEEDPIYMASTYDWMESIHADDGNAATGGHQDFVPETQNFVEDSSLLEPEITLRESDIEKETSPHIEDSN